MMALAGRTAAGLLAAVILGAVLKRRTPELALLLGLAALAWVLSGLVQSWPSWPAWRTSCGSRWSKRSFCPS